MKVRNLLTEQLLVPIQEHYTLNAGVPPPSLPPSWRNSPSGPGPPHYRGFTITFRHTRFGKNPLDM